VVEEWIAENENTNKIDQAARLNGIAMRCQMAFNSLPTHFTQRYPQVSRGLELIEPLLPSACGQAAYESQGRGCRYDY